MRGAAFNWIKTLKFPVVVGTLVCATILLGWKNAPILTAYLPSQSRFFGLSSAVSSEIQIPRNETLYKDDGLANVREDSTFSVKNDSGIGAKDVLFGSPVPYLPSQQTTAVSDEPPTSASDEMWQKRTGSADDGAAKNASRTYATDVSSKGTSPSQGDKISNYGKDGISAPVLNNSSKIIPVNSAKDLGKSATPKIEQTCNYAIGKWVADEKLPFYSGDSCKQWLSGMWACRMTERPDFAYEKFHWQPYFCDMIDFEGSKFLRRMQDKTLAFIGDSLGRQQFQSLICMITSGQERDDVINVGWEYGLVKAPGAKRPDGWAYRFPSTNTTILFYWSACLCDLEPLNQTDPQAEIAMHLDRPPSFLTRYIQRFDVLVLNTGHHWNQGKISGNKWIMYVSGKPNTDQKIHQDTRNAKKFTLRSIIHWVDSRLKDHQPGLLAFLRSMSPRHFSNGDWNTGGSCDNTIPLSRGNEVLKEESSDLESAEAVEGTKVKLLDITALSELRDEAHISKYGIRGMTETQDCLHWCLPGIPDIWNEILFAQL